MLCVEQLTHDGRKVTFIIHVSHYFSLSLYFVFWVSFYNNKKEKKRNATPVLGNNLLLHFQMSIQRREKGELK